MGEDKAEQKEAEAKANEGLHGEEFFFLANFLKKQQHELHERSRTEEELKLKRLVFKSPKLVKTLLFR